MFALFVFAFIVMPIIEICVMVLVAQAIGVLNMFGLLLLFSLVGVWIAKRAGISVLGRIRRELNEGKVPGDHLIDGGVVCIAGLLLIIPGFVSDIIGLVLLLPPTRALVRRFVKARWQVRVATYAVKRVYPGPQLEGGPVDRPAPPEDIIDV